MELLDIVAAEATAINSALASITGKKIRDFSNAEAKLKKVHESIQDRRSDPGSESTPEYASDVLQASLYEEVLREVSPTMRKTKKKKEVKETYFIGLEGAYLNIMATSIANNTIFAATENGCWLSICRYLHSTSKQTCL